MFTLSASGCDARRKRLLELCADERLDAVTITDARDVYYFTGTLVPGDLPLVYLVEADGKSLLVAPAEYEFFGVDRVLAYEWNYRGTRNPDPVENLLGALNSAGEMSGRRRIGIQRASLLDCAQQSIRQLMGATLSPIDARIAAMQRCKDQDEVALVRASIQANLGAYQAAQEAIQPGANELAVLGAGQRGAVRAAGEKVFHDGDYQCGRYNGPARNRSIEAGELYIIDAWTCYRGYWSDMSRTFIVGREPTDIQQALFDHIRWVQREAGKLLRPGVDGTEIYRALDQLVREHPPLSEGGLIHHGGHAIGLRIHEMPDINLERGGLLAAGNVICIEPGGYFDAARYGVRLENMYLITETGCENLCPGEIELLRCG